MYSPVEAFDISTVVANLPWYFSTFGGYSARTVEQEDLVAINVILMGTPIIWGIKSVGIVILEVLLITYALFFIAQPHSVTLTSGVTRGFEFIFSFIYAQVKTQLGLTNVHFFRLFFLLFLQVLIANYLGLLPFGVSPTSQAVVTAFISLNIWLTALMLGFAVNGIKFFTIFVPNVPTYMIPIMVFIEVLSYVIRCFSLAIRLCANLTAGHILLGTLASFILSFAKYHFLLALIPGVLTVLVFFLELGVSGLQAFVLVTLALIYFKDAYMVGHH